MEHIIIHVKGETTEDILIALEGGVMASIQLGDLERISEAPDSSGAYNYKLYDKEPPGDFSDLGNSQELVALRAELRELKKEKRDLTTEKTTLEVENKKIKEENTTLSGLVDLKNIRIIQKLSTLENKLREADIENKFIKKELEETEKEKKDIDKKYKKLKENPPVRKKDRVY